MKMRWSVQNGPKHDNLYQERGIAADGRPFLLRPGCFQDKPKIIENINAVCAEEIYLQTDAFISSLIWEQTLTNGLNKENRQLLAVIEVENKMVGDNYQHIVIK